MKKAILLWFWIFPLFMMGQGKDDAKSLLSDLRKMQDDTLKVNQLHKLGLLYIDSDSSRAFFYNRKALQLAQKLQWQEGIAQSNFHLGAVYNVHFSYDKALVFFKRALATSNQRLLSNAYLNIGGLYIQKSDYPKALAYFHRALKIDEAIGNQKGTAKIAANMGSVYYGLQNYKKALYFFDKAAQINEQIGNEADLAIVNRNKGGVYNSLGQPQKALACYEKANQLSVKRNDKALQARILSDIALVYFNLEDYDKAISNSQLSLKAIANGADDKQTVAFNRGVLGDSYLEKARKNTGNRSFLDSAMFHLKSAVALHKQLRSSRDLVYDYESMTEVDKLRGDYKSALASYENSTVYKDSIFNADNKETIKNLEDKRAIERRDREIKINKLELEAKERQKWFLLLGLALLGIIGAMLFYQSSNRRKLNKKLSALNGSLAQTNHELDQANKIKARFFSILNHDLRSPVYNLIHFLHLKKENPELLDEQTKAAIESKTMASAENLLVSMEDLLLWSKSQMENFSPQPEMIAIAAIFNDTQKHFESEERVAIAFENPEQIQLYTDENYLKTIIRNLTGNAIKALEQTKQPTIIWKAWREKNQIFLAITDNGPGGDNDQFKALYDDREVVGIGTGLGLHLIRDLSKAIDCEIKVRSVLGNGTTFTLGFANAK